MSAGQFFIMLITVTGLQIINLFVGVYIIGRKIKPAQWTVEDVDRRFKVIETRLKNAEWRIDQNSKHIRGNMDTIETTVNHLQQLAGEVKLNG